MASLRQNSIRLFRFRGIDLFLHWSWFLVAAYEIGDRAKNYSTLTWNVLEYLALFMIVVLHEFGHAFACRQVGGTSDQIVLWPLGGVAYVRPPQRPGAVLWSIAAGPLVNVGLLPILLMLRVWGRSAGWQVSMPDAYAFINTVLYMDAGLLIFNLLPIYPLDGGQILRSLLWFMVGRARSLMAATVLGFIGAAGFIVLAVRMQSVWFGVLSVFMVMNCWNGWKQARVLSRLAALPRHSGFACPSCKAAPPMGNYWSCSQCKKPFDTFQTQAVCPNCATRFPVTACMDCGGARPISEWIGSAPLPT